MTSSPAAPPDWPLGEGRRLHGGQRSTVWVADLDRRIAEPVWTSAELLVEAPNWAPDGDALLLNGHGLLWRLELTDQPSIEPVPLERLPPINNDHVVDPARRLVYLSANDGHIYVAPLVGGTATRITTDTASYHFLHGVSPDGSTLAYVALPVGDFTAAGRLALTSSTGTGDTRYPSAGTKHLDGPEYSPDGRWIYLNTEHFSDQLGHAQLARVAATGGPLEQLVTSPTVDWFPHLSPDAALATYVSFPAGTLGHPADLDVEVRVVGTDHWDRTLARIPLRGGQGTLNVNSWAPDSRRFAFVSYPTAAHPRDAAFRIGPPDTAAGEVVHGLHSEPLADPDAAPASRTSTKKAQR